MDDRERFNALVRGVNPEHPAYTATFRFNRGEGREIWLEETAKAEFDGLPEMRQIFRRHGHRQRDRHLDCATAFDGPPSYRPQICPAQGVLAFELNAVELEVELEFAAAGRSREAGKKLVLVCDANAIGVEQKVINSPVLLYPFNEFKEARMQRRLAAGELQDFNATFAIHDTLNAPL